VPEYFIQSFSKSAPFFPDEIAQFQEGETPQEALEIFAREYDHPAGLHSAAIWLDANEFHRNKNPIFQWEHGRIWRMSSREVDRGKASSSDGGTGPS
jgi:hypothetical protein